MGQRAQWGLEPAHILTALEAPGLCSSPPSLVLGAQQSLEQKDPGPQFLLILAEAPGLSSTGGCPDLSDGLHVGKEYAMTAYTAEEGGLALSSPETTASSRTFARQAAGVG